MAFKVWQEQPWGKDITFEQFCEYILPFRIADETPGYHVREEIYNRFNPVLDSVRNAGGDAVAACIALNNELKKDPWSGSDDLGFLPHFPASQLIEYRIGSCRDMTDAAVYIMRAVGIPVATDRVKQWPYKANSHAWNIVLDKHGRSVIFMGMEQSPGTTNKPGTKKGKVYRQTYALNPESLAMQKDEEDIVPDFFVNPQLKDVTGEYAPCFDVSVPVINKKQSDKYAYLTVFNNSRWIPVHWGKVTKDSVTFSKMEGGIAYLPVYYGSQEGIVPANYPLILDKDGKTKLLKPDTRRVNKKMVLTHMYPFMPDQFRVTKLWGGRFQGASKADFSDAVDLYTITDPMPFWNEAKVSTNQSFRYGRYLPTFGYQCDISELEFYGSGVKLSGKLIGSNGTSRADTNMRKAMDNNFATRFVTRYSTGTWVGIDFGKPQKIDAVRYAAGMNAKKNIEVLPGDTYELFYWGDANEWVSLGKKIAKGPDITFANVPSNALYLLQNRSKQLDKRIFTYENGKQVWW